MTGMTGSAFYDVYVLSLIRAHTPHNGVLVIPVIGDRGKERRTAFTPLSHCLKNRQSTASAQDWAQAQAHGGKPISCHVAPLSTAADQAATLPLETVASEHTQRRHHRYRACLETAVAPRFRLFTGDDPVAYVTSENAARRHLTESQLAHAVAAMKPYEERKAAERMLAGKPDPHAHGREGWTAAVLAAKAGVGARTVNRAVKVREHGVPLSACRRQGGQRMLAGKPDPLACRREGWTTGVLAAKVGVGAWSAKVGAYPTAAPVSANSHVLLRLVASYSILPIIQTIQTVKVHA